MLLESPTRETAKILTTSPLCLKEGRMLSPMSVSYLPPVIAVSHEMQMAALSLKHLLENGNGNESNY